MCCEGNVLSLFYRCRMISIRSCHFCSSNCLNSELSMSAAKSIPPVVNVINSPVDVSSVAVIAPEACLIAQFFMMMFPWLCILVSSAHAHIVNLRMQTSYVASDIVWTL